MSDSLRFKTGRCGRIRAATTTIFFRIFGRQEAFNDEGDAIALLC